MTVTSHLFVVRCAIWEHLHNLKNVKNTHWRSVNFSKVAGLVCNFTKINTPRWVLFTFFKLYKCSQIAQRTVFTYTRKVDWKWFFHWEQSCLSVLHFYFTWFTLYSPHTLNIPEAIVQRCSVKNSQENTCARVYFLIKFIEKETLLQVFSSEFCDISQNTLYYRTLLVFASHIL